MSVYEAKWFSSAGDDVTLFVPVQDRSELDHILRKAGVRSLDDLEKYGGNFDIRPMFLSDPDFGGSFDAIVWQATRLGPDQEVWSRARQASRVVTTNSGKFVPDPLGPHIRMMHARFKGFDLLACALREDYQLLDGEPLIRELYPDRYCHVPRGADPDLLHPGGKSGGPPVIGVDMPNNDTGAGVHHYLPALEIVRKRYPDLRVLSVGRALALDWSERIGLRPYRDLCHDFYDQIWLYLVMDYRHSPAHLRNRMSELMPDRWGTRAIYEVQNIEAQMSGAPIIGHPDNIIEELVDPGRSWLAYDDYQDPEAIADVLLEAIESIDTYREAARSWAIANHSWEDCIASWRSAIVRLLDSGYQRPIGR